MSIDEIDGVYTQSFQIKKYNFFVCNIVLHKSITMIIRLMEEDGREVHSIEKQIEGEENDAWGTDDTYLEGIADTYVKQFLNLVVD